MLNESAVVLALPGSPRSWTSTTKLMPATPFTVARPMKVARLPVTVKVSMVVDLTVLSAARSRNVSRPLGAASPLAKRASKPKLARPPAEVPRRTDISASSPGTCPPPVATPGVFATTPETCAAAGTEPSTASRTSDTPAFAVAGRTTEKPARFVATRQRFTPTSTGGQSRPKVRYRLAIGEHDGAAEGIRRWSLGPGEGIMRSYGGEGGHHADTRQLSVRGGRVRLAGPPADAHLRRLQGAVPRDRPRPPAPRGLSAGALSAAAARSLSRGERREKGRRPEGRARAHRPRGAGARAAEVAARSARRAPPAPRVGHRRAGLGTRRRPPSLRRRPARPLRPAARLRRREAGQHDRVGARRGCRARHPGLQPLLGDPLAHAGDARGHRPAARRSPGRWDPRLHLRMDDGPRARGLRRRRQGGRRARSAESSRRRDARGEPDPARVHLVRGPLSRAHAPRADARRTGRARQPADGRRRRPPRAAHRRRRGALPRPLRAHRSADGGMAAAHALPRHRSPLGPPLAEHADLRHRGRLSGPGPAGRDEPVGGARDDAAVRDLRGAVDRPPEDPPSLGAPPAAGARAARPRVRADLPQVGRAALPRLPAPRDRPGRLPSLPDDARAPAGRHRRTPAALRLEGAALRVRHRPAADRRAARRPHRARRGGARRRPAGPRALLAERDRGVPQGGAVGAALSLKTRAAACAEVGGRLLLSWVRPSPKVRADAPHVAGAQSPR